MPSSSSSSASPAAAVHSHHVNNSWQQDTSTRHAKKVVVIGAGPAGVHAAARLRAQGFKDISIFEAGFGVGGRCVSRIMHAGSVPVEAGFLANIVSEARNPLAELVVSREGGREGRKERHDARAGWVRGLLIYHVFSYLCLPLLVFPPSFSASTASPTKKWK